MIASSYVVYAGWLAVCLGFCFSRRVLFFFWFESFFFVCSFFVLIGSTKDLCLFCCVVGVLFTPNWKEKKNSSLKTTKVWMVEKILNKKKNFKQKQRIRVDFRWIPNFECLWWFWWIIVVVVVVNKNGDSGGSRVVVMMRQGWWYSLDRIFFWLEFPGSRIGSVRLLTKQTFLVFFTKKNDTVEIKISSIIITSSSMFWFCEKKMVTK